MTTNAWLYIGSALILFGFAAAVRWNILDMRKDKELMRKIKKRKK